MFTKSDSRPFRKYSFANDQHVFLTLRNPCRGNVHVGQSRNDENERATGPREIREWTGDNAPTPPTAGVRSS